VRTVIRWRSGTTVAGFVVLLLMLAGFVVQQQVTTGAFDQLEAAQVGQDALRVRMGLEARLALLDSFGATNSIWDASFDAVVHSDRVAFASDFPPDQVQPINGVDGVLGVGPDGTLRAGGLVVGDAYVAPPVELRSAQVLRRLFDPSAKAGQSRCGVVTTSTVPFLFCGFASHDDDGGAAVAGGLIYLRSLGGSGLAGLSAQMTLPLALITTVRSGATTEAPIDSTLGRLLVRTRAVSGATIALDITVPTVGGDSVILETLRPRPIHAHAASVARWLMGLMGLLGALLFGAVIVIMRQEVRRQVRPLRRTAAQVISSGDRTLRIAGHTSGELGALAETIDEMLDAMSVQDEQLRTGQEAREAQLRQANAQQRLASEYVRQRAQSAVDDTTRIVITELADVIREAQEVQASVSGVNDRAHATRAVTAQVQVKARDGAHTVEAVAESLARVSKISQLIAGVASQTNMLALNATIEAARAGQVGKGFAVVANEVKHLAATTTASTEEISATLAGLEQDVSAMANAIAEMISGVEGIGREAEELTDVAAQQHSGMQALDEAVQGAIRRIEAMATITDAIEGRRHERVAADGSVEVRVGPATAAGPVMNLSESGLRCLLHESLPVQTGAAVDAVLTLGSASLSLTGTVVWDQHTDAGHELGIEFRDPSAPTLRLVREAVDAAR